MARKIKAQLAIATVWEGDATWDVTMVVLGETPTESNFIF